MHPIPSPLDLLIDVEACHLVEQLAHSLSDGKAISSMSSTIYDTAWVSMIAKPFGNVTHWLFPECFSYILKNQEHEGGWEGYGSEIDCILNTMAALLALQKHSSMPDCLGCPNPADLSTRIKCATDALKRKLENWNVGACQHVGFEILVPALLAMLEQNGTHVRFSGRKQLLEFNSQKLSKFDAKIMYSKHDTTLIHSLEAFIGKIDFDCMKHRTTFGSTMASPSATAAYLMHSTQWDDESEAYLKQTIANSTGNGEGGVPSAFPSPIFEVTWVLSTLLGTGFSPEDLGQDSCSILLHFLETELKRGGGVVGFAPGLLADADDTAKANLTLSLLGVSIDPAPMVTEFEASHHFRTYPNERNASLSANCNILISLLHAPSPAKHQKAIEKATKFLCDTWKEGDIRDKWNLSPQYPLMLLAEAFTYMLHLWDMDQLGSFESVYVREDVPIILTQIATRTLQGQLSNGSWTHSCEVTAYSILALRAIVSLPWLDTAKASIQTALNNAVDFLTTHRSSWGTGDYVWIEKVTYKSSILSRAYCISAVKPSSTYTWGEKTHGIFQMPSKQLKKFAAFFGSLPLFQGKPEWLIKLSLVESQLYLPALKRIRLDIFPRKDMTKDDYLNYIPFTWVGINNLRSSVLSNTLLWDMMVLSMLNYQADEYMETAVQSSFEHDYSAARSLVHHLCFEKQCKSHKSQEATELGSVRKRARRSSSSHERNGLALSSPTATTTDAVRSTLLAFLQHVTQHPRVRRSAQSTQDQLHRELAVFLNAHITQNEDNAVLTQRPYRNGSSPQESNGISNHHKSVVIFEPASDRTFFDWVRTTAANHTSCPFSFVFFNCLIAAPQKQRDSTSGSARSESAKASFVSRDIARHLATLCRLYNDVGSIARDRAEGNLNAVNWPEISSVHRSQAGNDAVNGDEGGRNGLAGHGASQVEEAAKKELMNIAAYERECLELALEALEKEIDGSTMEKLRVFVDVTDLYGQIYIARDIASRMK